MAEAEITIYRPPLKILKGGSTLTKRRGGAIGRPRTRQPREPVRVALDPAELRQLEAKPIAALPIPEHVKALPPFQRLSLAQQIQITYAKQQPRVTRAVIGRRDKLIHSENVLNWRVEVWQIGSTRGTAAPRFFFRTESTILGARGGQNRRSKSEFDTPHECLKVARWKAQDRETLWRGRRHSSTPLPGKVRRWSAVGYMPPSKTDTKVIERITSCECPVDEATCPICARRVERNRFALRSHFRPHVSKGLLKLHEVDELLSFLVVRKCENNLIGAITTL